MALDARPASLSMETDSEKHPPLERPHGKSTLVTGGASGSTDNAPQGERATPGTCECEFLENDECFECPNKCGAKITRIRKNGEVLTIGKVCESQ